MHERYSLRDEILAWLAVTVICITGYYVLTSWMVEPAENYEIRVEPRKVQV